MHVRSGGNHSCEEIIMSALFGGDDGLSLTESIFGQSSSSSSTKSKRNGGGAEDTLFTSKQPIVGNNKRPRVGSNRTTPKSKLQKQNVSSKKSPLSRDQILSKRRQQSQAKVLDQLTLSLKDYQRSSNSSKDDKCSNTITDIEELCADVRGTMKHHGLVILRNALSNEQVTQISNLADDARTVICNKLEAKDIPYNSDVNEVEPVCFEELAVRCRGRMDVRYKDNYYKDKESDEDDIKLPKKGKKKKKQHENKKKQQTRKQQLPSLSLIDNLSNAILHGAESPNLTYAGYIFSYPNSADQPWHMDGSPLFGERGITESLPAYALNVFCGLHGNDDEGNGDNDREHENDSNGEELLLELGPTEFIVGSHHMEPDVAMDKVVGTEGGGNVVSAVLGRGDILLYDYRICHRGTSNISRAAASEAKALSEGNKGESSIKFSNNGTDGKGGGTIRKVLYLMYARPWFREHLNFGNDSLFA